MSSTFAQRVLELPALGQGISTEFGAERQGGLDIRALRRSRPDLVQFLEVGVDLERGVDQDAWDWARAGEKTTYHFLDLNLEEGEDLDRAWVEDTRELAHALGAAWLCGDAGLWHIGPRERGHATLMPPVLCADSVSAMADSVRSLRAQSGFEVLPENPPAHVYLGDLHLLDYFARVAAQADCGLLLDVAHLAVYQHVSGHDALTGFDNFDFERVVELHVAGGRLFTHEGRTFVDDDHGLAILPATWKILAAVLPRACNLRAIVLECERNRSEQVIPLFERLKTRA